MTFKDNWFGYRPQTFATEKGIDTQKRSKFKKKYYCDYNFHKCIKYINKKKDNEDYM